MASMHEHSGPEVASFLADVMVALEAAAAVAVSQGLSLEILLAVIKLAGGRVATGKSVEMTDL